MQEMLVDSIRVSLTNYQRVVILKEKSTDRYLPIWIGPSEADSIAVKLQDVNVPRPLTHDLLNNVIDTLGGIVTHITVSKLENDTFYAKIALQSNGSNFEVDCRPSDAIAIAIRYCCPIYVTKGVLSNINSKEISSDFSFNSIHEYKNKDIESEEATVKRLNKALDSAVNQENYEVAAKIRDRIKSIEKSKQD